LDAFVENVSVDLLEYIGMSNSKLLKFFEADMMREVLYNDVTKDYVVDEADFETVYQEYITTNKQTLETRNVNYVVTDTLEDAETVEEKFKGGADIYALIKEYSTDYVAPEANEDGTEAEDTRMSPASVAETPYLTEEQISAVYEMSAGDMAIYTYVPAETETDEDSEASNTADTESDEITDTFVETPKYIFVYVDNVPETDYDAIREEQRESYISGKKEEIYSAYFEEVQDAADIQTNDEELAKIALADIPS